MNWATGSSKNLAKSLAKSLGKTVLKGISAFDPVFNGIRKERLTGFLYHDVTDRPAPFAREFGLNVTPAAFERQIRWIKDNFYIAQPREILSGNYPTPAA